MRSRGSLGKINAYGIYTENNGWGLTALKSSDKHAQWETLIGPLDSSNFHAYPCLLLSCASFQHRG